MPLVVPLQALPNQQVQCLLGNQPCSINVYQQAFGLYTDLFVGGVAVVQGILSLNANLIVRNAYFGFLGDLAFYDITAASDPVYNGLNSRYFLVYFSQSEIAAYGFPTGVS